MSPLNIGLIISTMGVAWMLSGPFVGKLLKVIGGRLVVVIGAIFIGIGTYAQTTITADFTINELFISQALKGAENIAPAFDQQKDVYAGLFAQLDTAIGLINDSAIQIEGDIMFNGDMVSWRRFANTLKMTMALRSSWNVS